ncbi:MAG: type II toxin-antitoxin system VapC family toxin [Thaumarchaeota archaeon]|nr:type II toxin-antitoxin system VapC family toxin [Nitrososphaerota archaeon]
MKMLLLDTNIFLELFLGQKRASECRKLLERISSGDLEAVVTKFTIHAAEAVLNKPELILRFLRNLQNSIGLSIYETSIEDEMAASMLMDKIGLDFDDSLQYYVAKKLGAESIISYDKHFDKTDLPRKEPSDFI